MQSSSGEALGHLFSTATVDALRTPGDSRPKMSPDRCRRHSQNLICSIHSVLLLEQDSVDQAEGPTFGGKAGEQKDALTQCMLITQTMEYMDNGNTNPVTLLFLHRESGSQPCACSEGKNKKKSENVQKSRSGDHEEEHHTKGDISRSRTREGDGQKVPNQEEGPKLGCATTTGPRTSLHLVPTDPLAANHS
ncbi:uncharacterized protein [Scyliorhinus torazame]|uniref:uncharacterized protein isoform X4 n=1 Tax=Scyliorhinus torazame TaxID=75743 RepID=UPI003B5B9CB6